MWWPETLWINPELRVFKKQSSLPLSLLQETHSSIISNSNNFGCQLCVFNEPRNFHNYPFFFQIHNYRFEYMLQDRKSVV